MSATGSRHRAGYAVSAALGIALGGLVCVVACVIASVSHTTVVREWHPYGPPDPEAVPIVIARHEYTWSHVLGLGHDRYALVAIVPISDATGVRVPVPDAFTPAYADLADLRVSGDARGVTITYRTGERVFVPKRLIEGAT